MPRFIHRRAIVFFVLLCQVLAAGIVHVPMADAAQSPPVAATSGHCHDGTDAMHATPGAHHHPAPDSTHHCKSGFCACVCLSAPAALPEAPALAAPMTSRPPLVVSERADNAPERVAVFFRPPI